MTNEIKVIKLMYEALLRGDIKGMLSFFTDHATVEWGPFKFKGKSEIETWATDILNMFPTIRIIDKQFNLSGNNMVHKFIIETVNTDQSRGVLPASGSYDFKKGRLNNLRIELHDGYIIRKREEAKHYGIKI